MDNGLEAVVVLLTWVTIIYCMVILCAATWPYCLLVVLLAFLCRKDL